MSDLNWTKQESGSAKSITCETHQAILSRVTVKDFFVTVYRTSPGFKSLGKVDNFKEAIAFCEADYQESR